MFSQYFVPVSVLAGFSVAHPPQNITNSQPTQFFTPSSTFTLIVSNATETPLDAQISKRDQDPPIDWDEFTDNGINGVVDIVGTVMDAVFGDKQRGFVTVTVPGTPPPTNVAPPPTTTVVTTVVSPTTTVMTTVVSPTTTVMTTVVSPPTTVSQPTATETVVKQPGGGCYIYGPDGKLSVGPCH